MSESKLKRIRVVVGVAIAGAILVSVLPVMADNLFSTRGQPVVETSHLVSVSVKEGLATLKVQRTFNNKGEVPEQIEVGIDIPPGSVATGLRIKAQGKWYDGELMEARMAEIVYESLTGFGPWKLKDPALLFWEDLGKLNLYMFPVLPGTPSVVEYTLIQPLHYRNGEYFFYYPSEVAQDTLEGPTLKVTKTDSGLPVTVNNRKVPLGKSVSLSKPFRGSRTCEDLDDSSLYSDVYDVCEDTGQALIEIPSAKIDTVGHRYGVFDTGGGNSIVRLELDVAKVIRPKPKGASVVFVIDGSHSFGEMGVESAIEFCKAFTRQLNDAEYEVVVFARDGTRLFGEFKSSSAIDEALKVARKKGRLVTANGSNLDAGLSMAGRLLKRRRGPKRIIVLTDARMRGKYTNELSFESLGESTKNRIVHMVYLRGDTGEYERNDEHVLAPVALGNGGILIETGLDNTFDAPKFYASSASELVRPTKIDFFEILSDSGEPNMDMVYSDSLVEGRGVRYSYITSFPPSFVQLRGKIWAEPFVRVLPADPDFGSSTVPALAFGSDLYAELDEDGMMRAAAAAGAVSPVTSYLSIEPGTRPSVEGLDRMGMMGSGGIGLGSDSGVGCIGVGSLNHVSSPNYKEMLQDLAFDAALDCFAPLDDEDEVQVWMETSLDEIVDLEVFFPKQSVVECVTEAIWGVRLPTDFSNLNSFEAEFLLNS